MVLYKQKLLNDGFLSFNLKDVDESLYNELYKNFKKESFLNESLMLRYDGSIRVPKNSKIKNDINNYFNKFLTKFNLKSNLEINTIISVDNNNNEYIRLSLRLEGKYNSLNKFEKIINKFKYHTSQCWYFNPTVQSAKLKETLSDIYLKTLFNLYSKDIINNSEYERNTISNGTDLTLYTKNNFIELHQDGYVKGRLCVVLIYLNDDYKEGFGGELVINESNTIKPEFGNVTILDFTKNNIYHSVNSVLDDNFKRFAFIKFFYQ